MAIAILRRRKLGRTSCREMSRFMQTNSRVLRNDLVERNHRRHQWPDNTSLVIRWGCTSNIPYNNILNTASAIHEVNDKSAFRRTLDQADLCPKTFWEETIDQIEDQHYPLVVRPRRHAQGRRLFVVNNREELTGAIHRCGNGWYASVLVNKTAEYRVFVVQGRVVAVAQKTPGNPQDVAWNVARGGRFDNVSWDDWPLQAVRKSVEAYGLSSLDFGGVDVMVDGDGQAFIIEINSAPSLTSPYRQECMAKAFDYIIRTGSKERIPLIEERGGYRKFISPAVCDRAQMVE